jgi:membrane protease subunit HflC
MNKKSTYTTLIALSVFWIAMSSFYVVNESEQALVTRFGAPLSVSNSPGIKSKIPFIDTVNFYESRLLIQNFSSEQVILGDQKRLEVKAYVSYKITSPLQFFQSLKTLEQAKTQLNHLVSSSVRRELGKVTLKSLLSDERFHYIDQIQKEVTEQVKPLGIEIIEVRFQSADLPQETSKAIYDRMISERQREAKELRAQGFEWAQEIQSKADRERTEIISDAQKKSKIIRGKADAEANEILTEAFKKDPAFYKFYRTLQTYRQALADTNATLVLSPDSEFLRSFKSGPITIAK